MEAFILRGEDSVIRSMTTRTVTRTEFEGVPAFHVHMVYATPDSAGNTTADIVVRAADLALLEQRVKARTDSAYVRVRAGRIVGWAAPARQQPRAIDRAIDHPAYPNDGLFEWMVGLLPFKEGYRATLTFYDMWTDAEVVRVFRVASRDTVTVMGQRRWTWRIEDLRKDPWPQVVRWIDTETHEIVQQLYKWNASAPEGWSVRR
jgi:hypothetical protein